MNQFMLGAIVMASAIAGLFFLRFWRDTGDRLFAMFALAFWALAVNWLGLVMVDNREEAGAPFYVLRLLAFVLILGAIVDKNRTARRRRTQSARPPRRSALG